MESARVTLGGREHRLGRRPPRTQAAFPVLPLRPAQSRGEAPRDGTRVRVASRGSDVSQLVLCRTQNSCLPRRPLALCAPGVHDLEVLSWR